MNYYTSDELYHYGVVGMKWGVRRAYKKDARAYQKRLNSMDQESVNQIGKYMKYDSKAKRYATKGANYIRKHENNPTDNNAKKLEKITSKMKDATEKRDAARKAFEKKDSESWKVYAEAAQKGYTIETKQVLRSAERGRSIVQHVLVGPIGSATIDSIRLANYQGKYPAVNKRTGQTIYQAPFAVLGNKYKVTANG